MGRESKIKTAHYRIKPQTRVDLRKHATLPGKKVPAEKELKRRLARLRREIDDYQRLLYAESQQSLLVVFQALDAAGKDGTIRSVFRRVDPLGIRAVSFRQPTERELAHDFLWRTIRELPGKGQIGVFNRSHYEEVLVVRVFPEYLQAQNIPLPDDLDVLWEQRFATINAHERHLAQSGTTILKFYLHVSAEEQARRFIDRIDESDKRFKFKLHDVEKRGYRDDYLDAYEQALAHTSTVHAPWFVIPADDKPFARTVVAEIIADTLHSMEIQVPDAELDEQRLAELRSELEAQT